MALLVTNSLVIPQTRRYSQKLVCLQSVRPRYSASVMGCLPEHRGRCRGGVPGARCARCGPGPSPRRGCVLSEVHGTF